MATGQKEKETADSHGACGFPSLVRHSVMALSRLLPRPPLLLPSPPLPLPLSIAAYQRGRGAASGLYLFSIPQPRRQPYCSFGRTASSRSFSSSSSPAASASSAPSSSSSSSSSPLSPPSSSSSSSRPSSSSSSSAPPSPPFASSSSSSSSFSSPPSPPFSSSSSSSSSAGLSSRNQRLGRVLLSVCILTLGLSYLSVPLYRIFCQRTGYGGTTRRDTGDSEGGEEGKGEGEAGKKEKDADRPLRVWFTSSVDPRLHWSFRPSQSMIQTRAGESTLAFYTAKNNRDVAVTGVATYNVTPMKVGYYFTKTQCFCFDQQRLRPGEEVDMPVLFRIDKEFLKDQRCKDVTDITLSYTFFPMDEDQEDETQEGEGQTN